jgi:hypothetical protein
MSHTILDFVKDLGWNFLVPAQKNKTSYWDFNVKRLVSTKHVRSVRVVFSKLTALPEMRTNSMRLEVTDYSTIRLVCIDHGRKYTILSYRIKTRDLGSNDTHDNVGQKFSNDHVSSWLRSDKMQVELIEDQIIKDGDYETWACDTLRRRLMGLNKLPNLDSLFEQKPDSAETVDENKADSDTSDFMRMAAMEMMTINEMEEFAAMFGVPGDESESEEENYDQVANLDKNTDEMSRMQLVETDETMIKDLSWLDYVKMPFKPAIIIDSAVTNKYFDDFIEVYSDVFGKQFLNFFVMKPTSIVNMIKTKRKRVIENNEMFPARGFDEIV